MASVEQVVFLDHTLPSKCFNMFKNMRENEEFCDVIMRFENRTISAHRVIMFAVFPHLRDMLRNQGDGNGGREIISPIEPNVWESLISFAYSCELEITNDNVEDLLSAAVLLKSDEIQDACSDFISKQLNSQNVMEKLQFAERIRCSPLVGKCREFLWENFDEVSLTADFLNVPLSSLKELISSDDLRTSCEEKVFQAVMKWVRGHPSDRTSDLPELLRRVRLIRLPPQYLIDHVEKEEEIRRSIPCRNLVNAAKDYHLIPQIREQLPELITRPRKKRCVEAKRNCALSGSAAGIYAISKQVFLNVQYLDHQTGGWKTLETAPYHLQTGTAVSSADTVHYIDGGFLRSLTPRRTDWVSHNFVMDRFFAAGAVLGNKIYVCGGRDGKTCLNTVACFDLVNEEMDVIPPMFQSRSLPAAVALSGYLYVLGGHDGNGTLGLVERYNPISRTWANLGTMNTDRFGMGCTVHDGKIYVCGGFSTWRNEYLRSVEVYDPLLYQWEDLSCMNVRRYQCSLVSSGEKLYAVGGCSEGEKPLSSVEIYDPETDEWKYGPIENHAQKYVKAVSLG